MSLSAAHIPRMSSLPPPVPPVPAPSARSPEAIPNASILAGAAAIVDGAGRLRAVSSAFTSAIRVRRDELFASPFTTLVRVEDRPALSHAIGAVATGAWPGCTLEVRVLQHGRDDRAVKLLLEGDAPRQVRIHATDLTEDREATRTQQEYETSLRALTAHALDIWALLGDDGAFRSVSDSVSVHLGWVPSELTGHAARGLLHPEEYDAVRDLMRSVKADPAAVRTAVLRVRHRDGGWRTLEMTISGFNPTVLRNRVFVLNARDVTARERTEAALREVEYRFSQLVAQALTGIVVIRDGRLAYANPRFLELLGLEPEVLSRRPRVLSLVPKDAVPAIRDVLAELALGSHRSTRTQLRGRHTSGRIVEVDVATSVVDFEGRPALLCTVADMTEAHALQRRATEAEKIEAVGVLASGVAHDFNNLLTGILAWVDIATDELEEAHPVTNALAEIRTSAERAAELTQQLLAFGRRQLLAPGPVDLSEVVVRLKRWMDRVLGPDHRLTVTIPDDAWMVETDRSQIERALTALVMNAREAMPTGGEIRLTVEHEVLSREHAEAIGLLAAGEHVVVTVHDHGVGMDEPTRRRIFEPFFTTKPHGSGVGLGLAAVLGTILQSGGAVDVRSRSGVGTEFRCYFPRRRKGSARNSGPGRSPGKSVV